MGQKLTCNFFLVPQFLTLYFSAVHIFIRIKIFNVVLNLPPNYRPPYGSNLILYRLGTFLFSHFILLSSAMFDHLGIQSGKIESICATRTFSSVFCYVMFRVHKHFRLALSYLGLMLMKSKSLVRVRLRFGHDSCLCKITIFSFLQEKSFKIKNFENLRKIFNVPQKIV